jgi:hypothetical protein
LPSKCTMEFAAHSPSWISVLEEIWKREKVAS